MAKINISIFYKNYSEEELNMIKNIINEVLKDVDESNILEKINILSNIKYNKYPEIQYYRVNLLLRIGKINKAYKVASNCPKFQPLVEIANELKAKLEELEPIRQELVSKCIEEFIRLCPEVTVVNANEAIKDLVYEEAKELNKLLSEISKKDDLEEIINITKDTNSNHYAYMQYLRIRSLLLQGKKEKAQKILKTVPRIQLFMPLEKGFILNPTKEEKPSPVIKEEQEVKEVEEKEEVEEIIKEESKTPVEEPKQESPEELKQNSLKSILLTKLFVDNLSLQEIENSDLNEYEKNILIIAFYEKYNREKGIKFINKITRYYKEQGETQIVEDLRKIEQKFQTRFRKIVFDINYYERKLQAVVLYKKLDDYRRVIEKKETPKQVSVTEKKEPIKEVTKPKYITSEGISHSKLEIAPSALIKIEKSSLQKPKKVTIREALYGDIIVVEKEIYSKMINPERQKDAIKAWDIFENMTLKSVDDKEALNKVIAFLMRIDANNFNNKEIGIDIPANYKKYIK